MIVIVVFVMGRRCAGRWLFRLRRFAGTPRQEEQAAGDQWQNQLSCKPDFTAEHKRLRQLNLWNGRRTASMSMRNHIPCCWPAEEQPRGVSTGYQISSQAFS
jgi:hypothetical protein